MRITDMIMHIDDSLGERSRRNVERMITRQQGVLHAHFNEQRPHLMLVAYDTDRTNSFEILNNMLGNRLCVERIS